MARNTSPKDLSLKWLELFQICAHKGTLQAASKETGLTVSTVSHHIRNLEDHLARIIHQPNPISSGREGLAVLTGMT